MDKNITSSSIASYPLETSGEKHDACRVRRSPSEKTLAFLRAFARNYRASVLLPESLPGFVLG